MTRICVGRSRKLPGAEPYSSEGFTVSVEVETEIVTSEELCMKARTLFDEVNATLEAEVAGCKRPPRRGGSESAGRDAFVWGPASNGAQADAEAGNGNQPATGRQISYLLSLGVRNDIATRDKLERYIRDDLRFGCGLKELTRIQASSAIDALVALGNGKDEG